MKVPAKICNHRWREDQHGFGGAPRRDDSGDIEADNLKTLFSQTIFALQVKPAIGGKLKMPFLGAFSALQVKCRVAGEQRENSAPRANSPAKVKFKRGPLMTKYGIIE